MLGAADAELSPFGGGLRRLGRRRRHGLNSHPRYHAAMVEEHLPERSVVPLLHLSSR